MTLRETWNRARSWRGTPWVLLGGLTLAAAVLRRYRMTGPSLWEDEIARVLYSFHFAHDFGEVISWAGIQGQPPLSYWAIRIVYLVAHFLGIGQSDLLSRLSSVLFGVLVVPALFLVAREWFGSRVAWVAALLMALSPLGIRYSQEVGPYALWPLMSVAIYWALLRALGSGKWYYWVLTAVFMVASMYAHTFSALVIAFQVGGLLLLVVVNYVTQKPGQEPKLLDALKAVGCAVIAAGSFLPVLGGILSTFTKASSGVGEKVTRVLGISGVPPMPVLTYLSRVLDGFAPYLALLGGVGTLLVAALLVTGAWAAVRRQRVAGAVLATAVLAMPLGEYLLFVYANYTTFFNPRYIIGLLPLVVLAVALGLCWLAEELGAVLARVSERMAAGMLPRRIAQAVLILAVAGVVCAGNWQALDAVYKRLPNEDWRGVVQDLRKQTGPADVVALSPSHFRNYYGYYTLMGQDHARLPRYSAPAAEPQIGAAYVIAKRGTAAPAPSQVYGPFELARVYAGLDLWRLPVNQPLKELPLHNVAPQPASSSDPATPLLDWSRYRSGQISLEPAIGDTPGALQIGVTPRDGRAGIYCEPFTVAPGRAVLVQAIARVQRIGSLGAYLTITARDKKGSEVARYVSDPLAGTTDWVRLTAGGVLPESAAEATVVFDLHDAPKEAGALWIREIRLFGDWEIPASSLMTALDLPNAGFEVPPSDQEAFWWKPSAGTQVELALDATVAHQGQASLRLAAQSAVGDFLVSSPSVPITAAAGSSFVLQVWARTANLEQAEAYLMLGWLDAAGKTLGKMQTPFPTGTNDWRLLRVTGQAPEGAQAVQILPVRLYNVKKAGATVWVDDVRFTLSGGGPATPIVSAPAPNSAERAPGTLANTGFEELSATGGPAWWNAARSGVVEVALDTQVFRAGKSALRVTTKAAVEDYLVVSPALPVTATAGSPYTFEAWVKTDKLAGPKGAGALISITWFGADGKKIVSAYAPRALLGANDWQLLRVTGQVPEGARTVQVVPLRLLNCQDAGGVAWVDEVRLSINP